ncbi:hypothetical protein ACIOJD_21230 [Streptomyces sp. NPDC088116]|uniref:hypothetical protein n=1 Tax=Streptomyces sp. NPDC088116 TaxID=3365825 RepID=UPI00382A8972
MKRITRKFALLCVVATAALGSLALPADQVRARSAPVCAIGVCTWTEPGIKGTLRILEDEQSGLVLKPPVRSAVNSATRRWCFHEMPGFAGGKKREIAPGEAVKDLGFQARSVRPERC